MDELMSFNPDKYDLWPVYETIKSYYPIGIKPIDSLYLSYPGVQKMNKISVILPLIRARV